MMNATRMNERDPIAALVVSWGGFLGTIGMTTVNAILAFCCGIFSLVASAYAIKVHRKKLKRMEEDDEP